MENANIREKTVRKLYRESYGDFAIGTLFVAALLILFLVRFDKDPILMMPLIGHISAVGFLCICIFGGVLFAAIYTYFDYRFMEDYQRQIWSQGALFGSSATTFTMCGVIALERLYDFKIGALEIFAMMQLNVAIGCIYYRIRGLNT